MDAQKSHDKKAWELLIPCFFINLKTYILLNTFFHAAFTAFTNKSKIINGTFIMSIVTVTQKSEHLYYFNLML